MTELSVLAQLRLCVNALGDKRLRPLLSQALQTGTAEAPLDRLGIFGDEANAESTLEQWRSFLKEIESPIYGLQLPKLRLGAYVEKTRRAYSRQICELVFQRSGEATLTEAQLNAALSMFVDDVALCRRDAVDDGVLQRSEDGAKYALAPVHTQ